MTMAAAVRLATTSTSTVPLPSPSSIVDFLSADVQYSYFLRHLQRHGLIPQINRMQNVTVWAPVNLAFVEGELAQNDTRENLLRYFSDQRLQIAHLDHRDVVVDLMYVTKSSKKENRTFPLKLLSHTAHGRDNEFYLNDYAEVLEFDGYAKHQGSFLHAIDRLLPLSPSMCDILMNSSSFELNGRLISFTKKLFQLVFTPVRKNEKFGLCEQFLANVSTIFIPSDESVYLSMLPLKQRYYTTLFHGLANKSLRASKDAVREIKADALALLLNLVLPDLIAGVNGTSGHKLKKTASGNNKYNITLSGDFKLRLNDQVLSTGDQSSVSASDGLLYVFDTPQQSSSKFFHALKIHLAEMIPRKVLFALHYSNFVKEIHFRKLGYLIDGSTTNQTIILDSSDRDDVLDEDIESGEVEISSFSNKQAMLYRFLEGAVDMEHELTPESPVYHRMLTSKLCLKKRMGSCYRVKVSGSFQQDDIATTFNDELTAIMAPEHASGNNLIYVTDLDFHTPQSLKHTMAELISSGVVRKHLEHITIDKNECLKTLGYLNEFGLALLDDNMRGYSVFLPCGNTIWDESLQQAEQDFGSWKGLGLVLNYLESNPKVMKKVLQGLFVEDLIYLDFGLEDAEKLHFMSSTLGGKVINVSESYHSGDYNHLIGLNSTRIPVPLNSDVLFNQGVIHITSRLLLPDDFEVSLKNLILATAAKGDKTSFLDLLKPYPKLTEALGMGGSEPGEYSLFVPTPELLKSFNITTDYSRLWEFLELHLLPNNEVDTLLQCIHGGIPSNVTYMVRTNRTNGSFSCFKNVVTGHVHLQLQSSIASLGYNADHQVRLLTHGCTSKRDGLCVFMLDKPFSLGWFDAPDNFLHVHIGWISVGIGIIIGVILFGFLTTTLVVCLLSTSTKKKPLISAELVFSPAEGTYMRVTSDEDINGYYDYGYETDDDMMRNERDRLLPGKKKKNYESMSPLGEPSAPRLIKKDGVKSTLIRERNLPPLNI